MRPTTRRWLAVLCGAPLAFGASLAQGLPGLPSGSGRDLVARTCSTCHALEVVTGRRETAAGWAAIVEQMVARGAPLAPGEASAATAYLAVNFGLPGAALHASAPTAPPPLPSGLAVGSRIVKPSGPRSPNRVSGADWPETNFDAGATRYSPLAQINVANVGRLREAWTYHADPTARPGERTEASFWDFGRTVRERVTQVTPLVVDGILFSTTPYGAAVALEADTGRVLWTWRLAPDQGRPGMRSLAYRAADGVTPAALYFSTTNGLVIALQARTGRPLKSFGKDGVLDFAAVARGRWADTQPRLLGSPVFYRHVMITGMSVYGRDGKGPLGTTRGWDAHTGKLLWEFHGIPQPGEPNHETWGGDSWRDRDGAYSWGLQSVDTQTGTVFVPLSTVHGDFYGGDRPGDNLYGSSLVALDALTGRLRWFYQTVHHDLWDSDLHHAPTLIDIRRGRHAIPAVAFTTKRGLMFMLDRRTGKPVHPVEERPVLTEGFAAGERPAPTQPFPVRPGPLTRDHFTAAEIADITPEHRAYCEAMLTKGRQDPPQPAGPEGLRTGGGYMPFDEGGSLVFPSTIGGAEWQGMSYDPALRLVYVLTSALGEVFQVIPGSNPVRVTHYAFRNPATGWPCNTGPWGEMVAVNVDSGEIAWRRAIGEDARLESLGIRGWGTLLQGGPTSTAGGVTFVGGTLDGKFRAIESATGRVLWAADVGAAAHNIPITYLGRDGRQYVAMMVSGGGLLGDPVIPAAIKVFALPK